MCFLPLKIISQKFKLKWCQWVRNEQQCKETTEVPQGNVDHSVIICMY